MNYTVKLISFNRPGTKLKLKGVVVHETGNPGGTAQNHFDYWNAKNRGTSVQAVVDWNEVIQLIPYNEVSWHAGRTANLSMIGVELCRPKEHDEDKFNVVWDTAVKLFADIFIEQVGITTVTKDNLMSHAEVSDKWHETDHQDPISYFAEYNKTVDDFRWDVQQKINELTKPQLMPLADAVNVLVAKGIIDTPDYWVENAVEGKEVSGEYTGLLIQRVAELFSNKK